MSDDKGENDDEDRIQSGWKVKEGDDFKFHRARDGDDLLVAFECDVCIFSKLYKRLPATGEGCEADRFAMACIRRVVLDSFWSRAKSTVTGNTYLMRSTMKKLTAGALGHIEGPYGHPGPLPDFDHCGYLVAMQMVAASLGQGRYSPSYKQWDTIRRIKSLYSNHYRTTARANHSTTSMVSTKGTGAQMMTEDPCCSFWFQRFSEGCRKRMGQEWRLNKAMAECRAHGVVVIGGRLFLCVLCRVPKEHRRASMPS